MIKRNWHENGQLWIETSYDKGRLHGIEKYWYENGQIAYETPYHQGQKHGIDKEWSQHGELIGEIYYLYNNEVTKEEYRRHELIVKLSGL